MEFINKNEEMDKKVRKIDGDNDSINPSFIFDYVGYGDAYSIIGWR